MEETMGTPILLPSAPSDSPTRGIKRQREYEDDAETEVLESGYIYRAPLPSKQVSAMGDETYFIELMRKRIYCIRDIQSKWLSRTCNSKYPDYVAVQSRLKTFTDDILTAFEMQFGPPPENAATPPIRKHKK
jgi:hypothetical protein